MYSCVKHTKIAELQTAWEELYAGNPLLSPYQSYAFCHTVAGDYRFSHLRFALTPVFYEIRKDGRTVIIFPLWKKPGFPHCEYYLFPDFCLAGYLDPIYAADCADEDFAQGLSLLSQALNAPVTLRRVNEKSAFGRYLKTVNPPTDTVPCVRLPFPEGYDAYYAGLSKSVRQNLRTAYNRLNRDQKTIELTVCRTEPFEPALWQEALRIHVKRKRLRDGIREDWLHSYAAHHHDPLEKALKNNGPHMLFLLTVDGVGAAYFAGFLSNDGLSVVVPRLSIDDDFKFYSPGLVMLVEAIKYLEANTAIRCIDLCHGEQTYKYAMGGQEHFNSYFRLAPGFLKDGEQPERHE